MLDGVISLFVPNLVGGGAERVMVNLANGLVARGHRVEIVLLEKVGSYFSDLDPRVSVVGLMATSVRGGIVPLFRHLRRRKPAVLLSALDYANAGALLAAGFSRTATPVIVTVHSTHSRAAAHATGLHEALVRRIVRWVYPRADAVVAVSRGAADDMMAGIRLDPTRVHVIYNPVITSRLCALASEPLDHSWFGPGQPPVVMGMGRLTEAKDFPTLLRAVAIASMELDFRLLILGEGNRRADLEQMVAELDLSDRVALPGFATNPFAYLARSALFVLSSAWEALPTVLIEALALGLPVVSTDCLSGPAEILAAGRYGRLVPVGNPEALAGAIVEALRSPRPVIPEEVIEAYTVDSSVRQYEDLIMRVAKVKEKGR